MSLEPALSYNGALVIVGRQHSPTIGMVDKLLGGLLLFSPLGPLNLLGLVDPKNEATGLLRAAVGAATKHVYGLTGYDRMELVTAAHSVLATAAFFDGLRQYVGPAAHAKLKLTNRERKLLAAERDTEREEKRRGPGDDKLVVSAEDLMATMRRSAIPMPSRYQGWEENTTGPLRVHYERLAHRTLRFLQGLEAWRQPPGQNYEQVVRALVDAAERRYRDDYLRFAAEVPEAYAWAALTEHVATRETVRGVVEPLAEQVAALLQANASLAIDVKRLGERMPSQPLREMLASINAAAVERPVVESEPMRHIDGVSFPRIQDGYVVPAFRWASASRTAEPRHEEWWQRQELCHDLQSFLVAHFHSPDSCGAPLLVLGHPGAGKSLLTKRCAAWLSARKFTAVRVELRDVDPGLEAFEQIDQALQRITDGSATWRDLRDESQAGTLVVLLDGLDELIQATGVALSGYLRLIADFQRRQLDAQRAVAVVVTSRIMAINQSDIPTGSILMKLEDFDRARVAAWLKIWQETNWQASEEGRFRALSVESAMRHADLVRQPLLLMILALYSADPQVPDPGDQVLSEADLYRRLLDNFVRRELRKEQDDPGKLLSEADVADQLWHLGLVAFGMFNRGRQHINEKELDNDIDSLEQASGRPAGAPDGTVEPLTPGRRIISKFFFIHVPEAAGSAETGSRRAYEFMHATFGEYLVAATTVVLLAETAAARRSNRGVRREIRRSERDLVALISHQPFAKRQPIMSFARHLLSRMPEDERASIGALLEELMRESGCADFGSYRAANRDAVMQTAAYMANLMSLRMLLSPQVAMARLSPADTDPRACWSRIVRTWHAGLDQDGWNAVRTLFHADRVVDESGEPCYHVFADSVHDAVHRPALGRPVRLDTVDELDDEVLSTPQRRVQLKLGGTVTKYVELDYSLHVQESLRIVLELTFCRDPNRLGILYRSLTQMENYQGTEAVNASLLASAARDAFQLPRPVVTDLLEKLILARWSTVPARAHLAALVVAAGSGLADQTVARFRPWFAACGTMLEWRRAFASALLARPQPGAGGPSTEAEHTNVLAEAHRLAQLIAPPADETGWRDWFGRPQETSGRP